MGKTDGAPGAPSRFRKPSGTRPQSCSEGSCSTFGAPWPAGCTTCAQLWPPSLSHGCNQLWLPLYPHGQSLFSGRKLLRTWCLSRVPGSCVCRIISVTFFHRLTSSQSQHPTNAYEVIIMCRPLQAAGPRPLEAASW